MNVRKSFACLGAGLLTGLVFLATAPPVRADNLDDELYRATRKLFRYIHKKNARTVGVLKFRAQRGNGPLGFDLGPITSIMAERLETVLVMGNDDEKPVQIIRDASGVAAARRQKLTYLTEEGRKKLFGFEYPLVVGGGKATPDLFFTGIVRLDPEKQTTRVEVLAFGRDSKDLEPTGILIEAKTDRPLLADSGSSFVLNHRALWGMDRDRQNDAEAIRDAGSRRAGKKEPALKSMQRLVELKLYLDDVPVALEPDRTNPGGARFTCRPPRRDEKVRFALKNLSDQRVAVVLQINGMNTLYEQKFEAMRCNKWVLPPNTKPVIIDGFYIKDEGKNRKEFVVLPDAASRQEILRNAAQGTIQMHVFVEGPEKKEEETFEDKLITRGLPNRAWNTAKRSLTTPAAARKLLTANRLRTRTRGLIAPDQKPGDGSKLLKVDFRNPQEQQYLYIRYYPGPDSN
jgi:hypothetical protein